MHKRRARDGRPAVGVLKMTCERCNRRLTSAIEECSTPPACPDCGEPMTPIKRSIVSQG